MKFRKGSKNAKILRRGGQHKKGLKFLPYVCSRKPPALFGGSFALGKSILEFQFRLKKVCIFLFESHFLLRVRHNPVKCRHWFHHLSNIFSYHFIVKRFVLLMVESRLFSSDIFSTSSSVNSSLLKKNVFVPKSLSDAPKWYAVSSIKRKRSCIP